MTAPIAFLPKTDAEKSLLGAVLLNNDAIDAWNLTAEEFVHPKSRVMASAMLRLRGRSEPIDPVTLENEINALGMGKAVSLEEITDCLARVPTAEPEVVEVYADIVRKHAARRDLASGAAALAHDLLAERIDVDVALEKLGRLQGSLFDRAFGREQSVPMSEVVKEVWAELELRCQDGHHVGIETGLKTLDRAMGGLRRGVLTLLGGRTSKGKSALARTFADNISAAGIGVHHFSLEDTRVTLGERQVADAARVNLQVLAAPVKEGITKDQMGRLVIAVDTLRRRHNWLVSDLAGLSSAQIASAVRRRKRENGTQVVVVDYITKVREKGQDKRERVDAALDGLEVLARRENVAVLVLAQLSRGVDSEDRPPKLSDFKESGAIEEMSSTALLIHREDPQTKKPGERAACGVIVAKNKGGQPGLFVPLHWDAPTATYRDGTPERDYDRGGGA